MNHWSIRRLIDWGLSSSLRKDVHELSLALAALQLFGAWSHNVMLRWWRQDHRIIIILNASNFFNTWMLFLVLLSLKRLLESSSNSMEPKTYCRLVSRSGAAWLRVYQRLVALILLILKHWEIWSVSSIFECANYRFFDSKLLYGIRRVCSQSKLCHLWWIPILWVWVVWGCSFLRAKLIIALDNYGTKLKCILVWSLYIN